MDGVHSLVLFGAAMGQELSHSQSWEIQYTLKKEGTVPGLYIIQYIPSSINWKSGKIFINHKVVPAVSWDPRVLVTLTVSSKEEGSSLNSTLHLRIPFWTYTDGAKAMLNSQDMSLPSPGNDNGYVQAS